MFNFKTNDKRIATNNGRSYYETRNFTKFNARML